jgi:hypothetical protein
LNLEYIEKKSLTTDLKIIFKTFWRIVGGWLLQRFAHMTSGGFWSSFRFTENDCTCDLSIES